VYPRANNGDQNSLGANSGRVQYIHHILTEAQDDQALPLAEAHQTQVYIQRRDGTDDLLCGIFGEKLTYAG